jgi:hypothetical protein
LHAAQFHQLGITVSLVPPLARHLDRKYSRTSSRSPTTGERPCRRRLSSSFTIAPYRTAPGAQQDHP